MSPEAFAGLANAFRPAGLWLTLWNPNATEIAVDEKAPAFWRTLWSAKNGLRTILADHVRESLKNPHASDHDQAETANTGPLAPGIVLEVVPLICGARCAGVLLAAALTESKFDEPLLRLCDRSGLDKMLLQSQARDAAIPAGQSRTGRFLGLACAASQAHQISKMKLEVNSLTHNLQCTYEELHLIYQISGQMSLANKPARVLRGIGEELLDVCRAESLAFVLREVEGMRAPSFRAASTIPSLEDRIIQIGEAAPTHDQLDRLAECLAPDFNDSLPHVLINRAADHPELAWAADWLRHLVVLPLWRNHDLIGVMFAINCNDPGDFTSVDVQLFRAVADRVAPFLENHQLYDDLADLLMGLLHAMVNSIDAKDAYTCGHSERVALYAKTLAQAAHLPAGTCDRIYLAGLLHDVGKIGVPDAILCKTGKLTEDEFAAMKKHPEVGARILSKIRQIKDLLPGVMNHHERVDGRGYPDGLAGEDIPLFGRIICIADCFDAMTTNRTYRAAMPLHAAVAEVRRCSGTQFDPHLADVFLGLNHEKLMADGRLLSSEADRSAWIHDAKTSTGA